MVVNLAVTLNGQTTARSGKSKGEEANEKLKTQNEKPGKNWVRF